MYIENERHKNAVTRSSISAAIRYAVLFYVYLTLVLVATRLYTTCVASMTFIAMLSVTLLLSLTASVTGFFTNYILILGHTWCKGVVVFYWQTTNDTVWKGLSLGLVKGSTFGRSFIENTDCYIIIHPILNEISISYVRWTCLCTGRIQVVPMKITYNVPNLNGCTPHV